jgi:hypothetical protein
MDTPVLHRCTPFANSPSVEAPGRMRYSDLPPLQHGGKPPGAASGPVPIPPGHDRAG